MQHAEVKTAERVHIMFLFCVRVRVRVHEVYVHCWSACVPPLTLPLFPALAAEGVDPLPVTALGASEGVTAGNVRTAGQGTCRADQPTSRLTNRPTN